MPARRHARVSTAKSVALCPPTVSASSVSVRLRNLRSNARASKKVNCEPSVAGTLVYGCRELMEEILAQSDWTVLMRFSRLEKYSRTIVQYLVRRHLKAIVADWVGDGDAFLDMLQSTGGGITGSVARKLLGVNSSILKTMVLVTRTVVCNDLNLVMPKGRIEDALTFLACLGYTEVKHGSPSPPWAASVSRFATCIKLGNVGRRVTVSESRSSLLEVAIASPITAHANIVTASRVYCVYPHLLSHTAGLKTDKPRMHYARSLHHPYSVCNALSFQHSVPCGHSCAAAQRKTVGDKGIASFVFDPFAWTPPSKYDDTDYLLCEANILWRLSSRCNNKMCSNWTPCDPPKGLAF